MTDWEKSQIINELSLFFDEFIRMETPLFQRKIEGLPYYHFIRFHFFDSIIQAKGWIKKTDRRKATSYKERISIGVKLLKNKTMYGNQTWSKDHNITDILFLNSSKKVQKNHLPMDPFIDLLLPNIPHTYSIWEAPALWQHADHESFPQLFYLDNLYLGAYLEQSLHRWGNRTIWNEVHHLIQFIKPFQVDLSEQKIFYLIRYSISLYRFCYHKLLNRLKEKHVKIIFMVNHYEPMKMLMTLIAKKLGIYVVELQHGNMGRYHIAYNFGHHDSIETLPDEIFTFGDFWNNTTRIKQNHVMLSTVGMPFFEEKVETICPKKSSNKIRLLFLSQETIGQAMRQIAKELSQKLDPGKYELWYKLHPREYQMFHNQEIQSFTSSKIIFFADTDLYELLASADIHISVYSTTVMESLVFSKKLILLDLYGIHYFTELLRNGRAFFSRNADDVVRILESAKFTLPHSTDISQYWSSDSMKKMIARMNVLIKR